MALERANEIIGKSRDTYQCNHVVNYVLSGDKNTGGLARNYRSYGTEVQVNRLSLFTLFKLFCGDFISQRHHKHSM